MTTRSFMPELSHSARFLDRATLLRELNAVRALLREFVVALPEEALTPPLLRSINPPLWEAAHCAWFAEWWCLRAAFDTTSDTWRATSPSLRSDADLILNSNVLAHDDRWHLPQLDRAGALAYMDATHEKVVAALSVAPETADALYPFQLTLFHEAMHLEAFAWCAQTLGWPRPNWVRDARPCPQPRSVIVPSSTVPLGNQDRDVFSFDNERCGFTATVAGFEIDETAVTHGQFLAFVTSGAYAQALAREHPIYWRRVNEAWQLRAFDTWVALPLNAPIVHVNALEAEAYCHWAGRRLPTEQEWEVAARLNLMAFGDSVWEWTASTFAPYAGFSADRYREYSAPWFDGKHRVLRGGSLATLDLMHHVAYRNFFQPQRGDVFAGFRTCATYQNQG